MMDYKKVAQRIADGLADGARSEFIEFIERDFPSYCARTALRFKRVEESAKYLRLRREMNNELEMARARYPLSPLRIREESIIRMKYSTLGLDTIGEH